MDTSTRTFICKTQTQTLVVEHCHNTIKARQYCESFGHTVVNVTRLLPEGAKIVEVNTDKATDKTIRTVCAFAGINYTYQKGKKELKKLLEENNLFMKNGYYDTWLTGACDM
jgi:hypothetical protein